jgi:hypothetical protein
VLRELPETELPDPGDYERWYFEVQRAMWEAEEREADKARERRNNRPRTALPEEYGKSRYDQNTSQEA